MGNLDVWENMLVSMVSWILNGFWPTLAWLLPPALIWRLFDMDQPEFAGLACHIAQTRSPTSSGLPAQPAIVHCFAGCTHLGWRLQPESKQFWHSGPLHFHEHAVQRVTFFQNPIKTLHSYHYYPWPSTSRPTISYRAADVCATERTAAGPFRGPTE